MRAIIQNRYGPPEDMRLVEVPVPKPKPKEVLVRVKAVGLNATDWECKVGRPAYARISGPFRPGVKILGSDIAGEVVEIGAKVTGFAPGDRVIGDLMETFGGLADYVAAPQSALLPLPEGMTDVTAAALPQSLTIAHQGMTSPTPLAQGQRVLINGAGGGGGTMAVQIARAAGAIVTAVDAGHKLDRLRHLGADEVIDFAAQDFSQMGQQWDRILDLIGTRKAGRIAPAIAPGGTYWVVGGPVPIMLNILVSGALIGRLGGKKIAVLAVSEGAEALAGALPHATGGTVQPVIDRTYELPEAPAALRYLGDGRVVGKVVVKVSD